MKVVSLLNLKIRQKLLLFWFGAILLSLLLLGITLSLLISRQYEANARGKIAADFNTLSSELHGLRVKLERDVSLLAARPDVVSITSLVDTYQDIGDYQPLVFDGEKRRLARLLSQQAMASTLHHVSVYDSKRQLIACNCASRPGSEAGGYSSVQEGELTYLGVEPGAPLQESDSNLLLSLPQRLPSGRTLQYRILDDMLVIDAFMPVTRTLPDGAQRVLGVVRIVEYLDEEFVERIRRHTAGEFMFSVGERLRYGGLDGVSVGATAGLPLLGETDFSRSGSVWRHDDRHFLGFGKLPLQGGAPVVFVFGVGTDDLVKNFEVFKTSIIAVLIVMAMLVLPAGFILLSRNISQPLERLASGVRALGRGDYIELDTRGSRDEIGELAHAFNEMSQALRSREAGLRKLSLAVEQSPVSVMITDPDGCIEYVNDRFVEVSGYSREEALGAKPSLLKSGNTPLERYRQLWDAVLGGSVWRGQLSNRRKNGELYWEEAVIAPVKDGHDQVTHLIAVKEDITLRKSYEEQLLRQANYDSLTDLPNRLLVLDRLSQALAYAGRHELSVAVIFIDLDNFKKVNDTLGHAVGDALLVKIAHRFGQVLRGGDTLARLGGDEFLVVIPDVAGQNEAGNIAEKIIRTLEQSIRLEGREIYITASLGISLYPTDGQDSPILMRNADAAMYHAKDSGRNTYRFFTPAMNENALRRLEMESRLRHALKNGELSLHYQPQVGADGGELLGAEALLRWHNPVLGQVPPDKFIPLAEDLGVIHEIGEWILLTACCQAYAWFGECQSQFRMAVNVSPLQLRDGRIVPVVRRVLEQSGLPPAMLELELTEGLLMENPEEKEALLRELKRLGVTLALDDFGTGYSSLSYLRRFPFDILKIDRSFIRDLTTDPDDAELTLSIISMAHSLRLQVVAEGVETLEQLQFLQAHRCDLIQGFYFSKPLPAAGFSAWLDTDTRGRQVHDR
ncbi:putative bifunctional diguanylate cyclase/phosphodiesterase [Sedimenticola hydrogenitrophicus]|uniref:putative bifunctional diguanylate cyclase/phosphodiesterase n=1 Tax=Sedimenticola hydrogenitrophicus TaxID=2967975 RepID=UPI0023B1CA0C|nr:EAL domain-containing protein [Sedimenticola hydrogenitrophicus]